jgi:hypothetical protein
VRYSSEVFSQFLCRSGFQRPSNITKEAAYWREQHSKQPYAKNYLTINSSTRMAPAKPASALPWDTVRPAASAVWVIALRDPDRGIRGSI